MLERVLAALGTLIRGALLFHLVNGLAGPAAPELVGNFLFSVILILILVFAKVLFLLDIV